MRVQAIPLEATPTLPPDAPAMPFTPPYDQKSGGPVSSTNIQMKKICSGISFAQEKK
jgi:hypothetical protein